ncbi:ABC transporter ATP-binding protein [Polycladomyces abyssicola]|uniref:ABC transporter ATP-binding protein n=1 Tax=Polycladomyces abyssicola TaxID=1125966 RepID=A0A8D5UH21_9BACL|nr:ABC transporter ATP-binding protein [Polycladomyces abyssicola]BCU82588.1 ABC transporter ATP-binding protein [Polycladomyces abyssicola]
MAEILAVQDLTKRFGGLTAVDGVTFTVNAGDILGIIGPNGAGKTTLFNLITGFLRPDRGTVIFRNQPITGWKAHRISRLGLTRTFQITKPFGNLDVRDNVAVAALRSTGSLKEARDVADEVLGFVGLESYRHHETDTLPIGLKKKLELAKALATRPSLLFLDEVMGGLSAEEVRDLIHVLHKIHDAGTTLVVIEHVLPVITELCNRVIVLHHGAMLTQGPSKEVLRHPEVVKAYLGEVHPDAHN